MQKLLCKIDPLHSRLFYDKYPFKISLLLHNYHQTVKNTKKYHNNNYNKPVVYCFIHIVVDVIGCKIVNIACISQTCLLTYLIHKNESQSPYE